VFEAAYVGSSGINIGDYSHVNLAAIASPSNPIQRYHHQHAAERQRPRPYLGFTPIGLQENAFDGVYNYNSLAADRSQQFSRGFGFTGGYTCQ
jgi:hypothetical protein